MSLFAFTAWFREKGGTRRVAVVFGCLYVLSQAVIYLVIRDLPPEKLIALQTTFSKEVFLSILSDWEQAGVTHQYVRHFYIDFLHPLWYSLFLASLMAIGLDINRMSQKLNLLLMIPFAAGLLDLVENSFHVYMLINREAITGSLIFISALAASLKWLLAGIAVVMVVGLVIKWSVTGRGRSGINRS